MIVILDLNTELHRTHPLCVIEEYPINSRRLLWLKPRIPPLITLPTPKRVHNGEEMLEEDKIKNKGLNFWIVDKIKHPNHDNDLITNGTHWKNGKTPSFMHILRKKIIPLSLKKENKNIADPPACTRKYFTILSISKLLPENIGINPNKDSSKPIQVINQLFLLITILNPKVTIIKKINHEGWNLIIN